MKVMKGILSAAVMCAVVGIGTTLAKTAQELRLSNPVAFEAVFPQVVFGSSKFKFESEITVVNNTGEDAFVELESFDSVGRQVRIPIFDERVQGGEGTFIGDSKQVLFARSAHTFRFPPPEQELRGQIFAGWVRLRSTQKITASHKLRLVNPDGFTSGVDFLGNESGVRRARVPIRVDFRIRNTGIGLVNPGTKPVTLILDLVESGRKTQTAKLTLAPGQLIDSKMDHSCVWNPWRSRDGISL